MWMYVEYFWYKNSNTLSSTTQYKNFFNPLVPGVLYEVTYTLTNLQPIAHDNDNPDKDFASWLLFSPARVTVKLN